MIRATRLLGLPIVDVDAAVKIGRVHQLILDPGRRRVAAVVVRRGRSLFDAGGYATVPAAAVVSIGADALTTRSVGSLRESGVEMGSYPSLGSLIGRKMLSRRGTMLGSVGDVLLDERTGTIVGYALDARTGGGLFALARRGSGYWPDYVKAEADLRFGRHIVVTPDGALVRGEKIAPLEPADAGADPVGWQVEEPYPALTAPPPTPLKRLDAPRSTTTTLAHLRATIPVVVNGNGRRPEGS